MRQRGARGLSSGAARPQVPCWDRLKSGKFGRGFCAWMNCGVCELLFVAVLLFAWVMDTRHFYLVSAASLATSSGFSDTAPEGCEGFCL